MNMRFNISGDRKRGTWVSNIVEVLPTVKHIYFIRNIEN